MKIWNFGIVGAGLIADFHCRAIRDIPNAKFVACCDTNLSRAQALAEKHSGRAYASYQEMLQSKDIDIVTIATPSGLHMEPTVAAAKAGKHVICEKPVEITLERIDAMIDAHAKAGTRLGGIFPYRFNDMMGPIREAIRSGRLGTITCASVYVPWWRTDAYYEGSWRGTWKLDGGGALMNQSIHMIDMLCDLMPPIESVQAFTATLGHKIETEDVATAVVRYTTGALGMIYGTTGSYPGQFRRFEITGTKGTIINVENSITVWQFADEKPEDAEVRSRFTAIQGGGGVSDPAAITHENHTRNFKAFLESLETGRDFWISGPEARKAVEVILAVYRSAKEGRPVKLR
ncbi:MAG TPA: Gfo/Idh/MocA family oxidoreductase [Sedimentisphaerales bacterium]|nr:Gfo/Idh/MocA family oxidoreductase [Sedimentisphaerales bacterium]